MKFDWTLNRELRYELIFAVILGICVFALKEESYLHYLFSQRGASTLNEARIIDVWQSPGEYRYVYLCDLGNAQFIGDFSCDSCAFAIGDSIIIQRNRMNPEKSKYYSVLKPLHMEMKAGDRISSEAVNDTE